MPGHAPYRNPVAEFACWLVWRAYALLRRAGRWTVQACGDLVRSTPAGDGLSPRWLTVGLVLLLLTWVFTMAVGR